MNFDLPTLMLAGSFVAATSGVFMIIAWLQDRSERGPLWWGVANLVLAAATPLMTSQGATLGVPAVLIAITLLNVNPALIWAAARSCNHRRIEPLAVAAGACLWLLAYAMPVVRDLPAAQMALNFAIIAIYLFAAVREFWNSRSEQLDARWPLITLLSLHGLFFAFGATEAAFSGATSLGPATLEGWFGFVHFETIAFTIGTGVFTVAMTRERTAQHHRIAASVDALTGVAARRAFYDEAGQMLARSLEDESSLAVIVFDLDGFKAINDTFGHGPGDQVLAKFGEAARMTLRSTDLIGRLGGEEFAAMLPGASVGAAYIIADRIRVAFGTACATLGDTVVKATVSAGVARSHHDSSLDTLMKDADAALYRAKLQGRNRVAISERELPSERTLAEARAA